MPEFGYSFEKYDSSLYVKTSGRELNVSPKTTREICNYIKNMGVNKAKSELEEVIKKKKSVPFKRYKLKVGHRSEFSHFHAGRYPVKAAKLILKLLDNLESNAEFKGVDIDKLTLVHCSVSIGRKLKRYVPRAFGRTSPSFKSLIHIELVGREL